MDLSEEEAGAFLAHGRADGESYIPESVITEIIRERGNTGSVGMSRG